AAAKILKTFSTEFKKPEIKTGVVDKLVVSSDQIRAIADLPSREVLLATLLGVLQAPATQLVRVLNEPASSLARVLKAKADRDGAGAEAATETPAPATEEPAAEAPAADAPAA
ncbi:MAG TPA: 50S ribosomal protein L10, partial [Chthoniobacteraceae bacterium]